MDGLLRRWPVAGASLLALAFALCVAMLGGCAPNYSPDTYAANAAQQANKVEQGVIVGVRPVGISAPASSAGRPERRQAASSGHRRGRAAWPRRWARSAGRWSAGWWDHGRARAGRYDGVRIRRQGGQGRSGVGYPEGRQAAGDRAESAGDCRQPGARGARLHGDAACPAATDHDRPPPAGHRNPPGPAEATPPAPPPQQPAPKPTPAPRAHGRRPPPELFVAARQDWQRRCTRIVCV